jgi:hypothetical protein
LTGILKKEFWEEVVVSKKGGNEEVMVAKLLNFIGLTDSIEVLFTEISFTGGRDEKK